VSREPDLPSSTVVVIVNYRTKELTRAAISSVLPEPEVDEVVVVDNGSGDGSAEYLRSAFAGEAVHVIESGTNRGFGPAVNLGVGAAHAPLLLILNSDATLRAGSLARLAQHLISDPAIGIVAPSVYEADGRTLQPGTYGRLPMRRDILLSSGWVRPRTDDPRYARTPEWVSGVAMLVRRADFLAVGGFDPAFTMYLEDVDLCRRLREAGLSIRREPAAVVVHEGGRSWQSTRDQRRRFHDSKLRYFENLGVTRIELQCVRLAGLVRTSLVREPRGASSRG
jgi:N-acetylglucosaminyl-diphospho-decaprenol L-rhamnosyltransferase